VKVSLLRGRGSFGGRSKITQTFTSDRFLAQILCPTLGNSMKNRFFNTGATSVILHGGLLLVPEEIQFHPSGQANRNQ